MTPQLWLGTAQFANNYGVTNATGAVGFNEAARILESAHASRVTTLDTAPAYGNCERMLGELEAAARFRILTKTPQLKPDIVGHRKADAILRSLDRSLEALRSNSVRGLLVHGPRDLLAPGADFIFEALRSAKEDGRVEQVGVSVYDPEELVEIGARYDIDMVQVPLNVFDRRFQQLGLIDECRTRHIAVCTRSVFLQGLLLVDPLRLPPKLSSLSQLVERFHDASRRRGYRPLEACLAIPRSDPGVEAVVCGVTSLREFEDIASVFQDAIPKRNMFNEFAQSEREVIDPRSWS